MKGTIYKAEHGWQVSHATYNTETKRWTAGKYDLHPDFVEMMDSCFTSKFTRDVEFEIVEENVDTGALEAPYIKVKYAKLIPRTE